MAIAVNLLNDKHTLSESDYQHERKILQYSAMFFTVVVIVTMVVGIFSLFLTNKLNMIEDDIARGTNELKDLTVASAQQIYLKNRLQLITAFLDGRSVDREAMQRVFSFNIPGVVVSSVGFVNETTLGIQLTAETSAALTDALDSISAPSSFFTQVVSKGVSRAVDGSYQMQILLTVPRGDK